MIRWQKLSGMCTVVALSLTLVSTCSSSSAGASSNSSTNHKAEPTIKIGVLTALSGALEPSFTGTVSAVQARIDLANATNELPGVKLQIVTADDQSSATGALAGAQQLISDGVTEMVIDSPYYYAAQAYVKKAGIPVMGMPFDPSWGSSANQNQFAIFGSPDPNYGTFTGIGAYLKNAGGTTFCGVGTPVSPPSLYGVKELAASAKLGGLTLAYMNTTVPLEQTDFSSVALQMKSAGCNTLGMVLTTNATIDLLTALKNEGVHLKASWIAAGYSQSVIADPTAQTEIQGLGMVSQFEPTSLHTPGVERMMGAMKKYVHYTAPALTQGGINGWFGADLAVEGLHVAAPNYTSQAVITKLRRVTSFDHDGLTCPLNFTKFGVAEGYSLSTCGWVAVAKGGIYQSATGVKPIHFTIVTGSKND